MPQPLSRVAPKSKISFPPDALSRHPNMASDVALVVACWASIDVKIALLLAQIADRDPSSTMAMYNAVKSDDARRSMVLSTANENLEHWQSILVNAVFDVSKKARASRNKFVHHIWGSIENEPEMTILAESIEFTDYCQSSGNIGFEQYYFNLPEHYRKAIQCYKHIDIINVKNCSLKILEYFNILHLLVQEMREAEIQMLLSEPRILRVIQKNASRSGQPIPPQLHPRDANIERQKFDPVKWGLVEIPQ